MAMQLSELTHHDVVIDKLTIHSFDMNLYLAEVIVSGHPHMVCDTNGRPVHFKSVQHVKEQFADTSIVKSELRHESPYDEMIGNPPSSGDALVIPINISSTRI